VPPDQPAWMREFAPIVELLGMQPAKTYVSSPPELEMIWARTSAGQQPKNGQPGSVTNDWDAVWLQLSGISMCEPHHPDHPWKSASR
jgi:CCR4-NOT transcriptional complex subunit CAF120